MRQYNQLSILHTRYNSIPITTEHIGILSGSADIEPQTVPPGSTTKGLRLPVSAGDAVIQPAGTAHSQTNAKDYRSIAASPEICFPCIPCTHGSAHAICYSCGMLC
ncbi:uncharacterized protein EURHEDRAFT_415560 [Aspergillus ruber CBS 135680]|uniref:Cupin type-1 domain-containing protein n=1 Tax=Aspergillus ruber (strain CBS 135680) TaxID=1388766 RepID=A0A017S747_ASPRC|nr:uncharacterized protein EURHEDRAFT_415560 [Aspergillus ruber CBS 135680]EYE92439.1 hypothetical protein EURHEDRAFT_415560 [Aspergillus ruber CBS 135680]